MKRFLTLLAVELKLALRSPDMVLFAILMPVIVLVVVRLVFGPGSADGGEPGMIDATIGAFLAIGLVIASTARDVKRAGIIASVIYFPMLLFSGTTVPFPVFPEAVQRAAVILPLRHGIELLNAAALGAPLAEMVLSAAVLAAIAVVGVVVSVRAFRWDMG